MSDNQDERSFNSQQITLRKQLRELIENYGVCVMKLSTEDAGMPFEDIQERHRLFGDLLPIQLKIGGPEARNDIRMGIKIGCRSLIAPMIESPYALKNFITACRETLGGKRYRSIDKLINIETRTGVEQLKDIVAIKQARELTQITLGRHDLCRSLECKPNHPRVVKYLKQTARIARDISIPLSIGGRITPGDAALLTREFKPAQLNTRELGFQVVSPEKSRESVKKILDFEIHLFQYEKQLYQLEVERLTERIKKLRGRVDR